MARNTIQIPINKSSNDDLYLSGHTDTGLNYNNIPRVSDSLYLGFQSEVGVAWDGSLVPTNKIIVSVSLKLYSQRSCTRGIGYKYAEFGEGSPISKPSGLDSSLPSIYSGWTTFNLPKEMILNSVVMTSLIPYNSYGYYDYAVFNSHRASSNKPYVEIVYDDIPPDNPTSLYPSGITLNPRDIIRFAWEHNSKEGLQQKGFTIEWQVNGGAWQNLSQSTANQFYDMPANTLPTTGNVTWRIKTLDDNTEESGYTSSSFTLGIVPQKAPIPIAPISQYIDESDDIRFEWNFVGGSPGETQKKFDLQYSANGGNTWITKTLTTANKYYDLFAGILETGNITWRVRTYNNWNEVSPYSENRSFTIIGSPPIPLITNITNSGKPTINWQSQGQHLYELQILENNVVIFDSGIIPSTADMSLKLGIYLKDGNYKAKLRVFNEFNLNSPWAEKTFIVSTVKPSKPVIRVFNGEYTTTINVSNLSSTNLVYRDNILIGEVKGNQFTDYTGKNGKEYKYFVRAINSSDNFADSDTELGNCKFKNNTLAILEKPEDFLKLKYGFGSVPGKSNIVQNIGSLNYYDGREYPVAEYTEFKSLEKTLSFFVKNREEVDKLIELIDKKETLLYRDCDGENIKGTVFAINHSRSLLGYNVDFTINKTEV